MTNSSQARKYCSTRNWMELIHAGHMNRLQIFFSFIDSLAGGKISIFFLFAGHHYILLFADFIGINSIIRS